MLSPSFGRFLSHPQPYHGWTFESSGSGACTKIPQASDPCGDPTLLAKAPAVPVALVEKQGMLWGWGQPGALASLLDQTLIPTCEAMDDPSSTTTVHGKATTFDPAYYKKENS